MASVIAGGAGQRADKGLCSGIFGELAHLGDGDGFYGASLGFGRAELRGKVLQKGGLVRTKADR